MELLLGVRFPSHDSGVNFIQNFCAEECPEGWTLVNSECVRCNINEYLHDSGNCVACDIENCLICND